MSNYKVDTVVIGAGAVGLAIAENLSKSGREVLVLDSEDNFGKLTSSTKIWKIMKALYLNIQKFLKIKQKLLVN